MTSIKVGSAELKVRLAKTPKQQSRGLMNVQGMPPTKLPPNEGMLFIYRREEILSFWMKNTTLPLSIAFIDKKGTITEIKDMVPESLNRVKSSKPAQYALEVNKGWFQDNNVKIGDIVEIPGSRSITIRIVKLPPEAKQLAKTIEDKLVDMTVKALKSKLSVDQLNNLNIDVEVEE